MHFNLTQRWEVEDLHGCTQELIPEPLRSAHAPEWHWVCGAAPGYTPSLFETQARVLTTAQRGLGLARSQPTIE